MGKNVDMTYGHDFGNQVANAGTDRIGEVRNPMTDIQSYFRSEMRFRNVICRGDERMGRCSEFGFVYIMAGQLWLRRRICDIKTTPNSEGLLTTTTIDYELQVIS